MGKVVMPKNSAIEEEIMAALKIYYDENDWMKNDLFTQKLKDAIGEGQYPSSYTKKVQMTSYFGFTVWENYANAQSRRKITDSGKRFYLAWEEKNKEKMLDEIMYSLEHTIFGRDNCGCSDSDSDVEIPSVFIRAVLELEYLTYNEFAYLLWWMEDCGMSFTDGLRELKAARDQENLSLTEEAKRYTDAKPIMMLIRWGFLSEDGRVGASTKIIISQEALLRYEKRLRRLKIYNVDKSFDEAEDATRESISKAGQAQLACRNRIIFGAPGTGKSYTVNREKEMLLSEGGEYERVTFHPDYSYANFVGTYKPAVCKDSDGNDSITYEYVPGPFMRILVKALKCGREERKKPYLLIIEEINRANVAAVFGDVFQLLDRGETGDSEYPVMATEDMKKYLSKELNLSMSECEEVKIPDNMFIWATMNSADQGVFPIDTAFKRRWEFTYIGIDDGEEGIAGKTVIIGEGEYKRRVEWNALRKAINGELLKYKVNEDKLLGPYFAFKEALSQGNEIDSKEFARVFKNKVLMYLFDDAAKQKRPSLFAGCEEKNLYSAICKEFDEKGIYIFCEELSGRFIDMPKEA